MNIETLVDCPFCQGKGQYESVGIACTRKRGQPAIQLRIQTACRTCGGAGKIPPAQAARIEEGMRRRQQRIADGLSIFDKAKQLGIKPKELNDIEYGR